MSSFTIFLALLTSAALSAILTASVRRMAQRLGVVDDPTIDATRRQHVSAVPLLGGLGLFCAFALSVLGWALFSDKLFGGYLLPKHILGIITGGIVLMLGGFLDDRRGQHPRQQLLWTFAAIGVIVASGIGATVLTLPVFGTLHLDSLAMTLFTVGDQPYRIVLFADALTVVWLLGMMYTTKLLDGLDGLATGIGAIGAIVLYIVSVLPHVAQPETGLLALLFAGSCIGFLFWNFTPAKIFLGQGGSLLIGFVLGVLAIISGAKVATAALVMGLPIADVAVVIVRRLRAGQPWSAPDRRHLHFMLVDSGLSPRKVVLLFYAISAILGILALLLPASGKIVAFGALAVIMVGLYAYARQHQRRPLP